MHQNIVYEHFVHSPAYGCPLSLANTGVRWAVAGSASFRAKMYLRDEAEVGWKFKFNQHIFDGYSSSTRVSFSREKSDEQFKHYLRDEWGSLTNCEKLEHWMNIHWIYVEFEFPSNFSFIFTSDSLRMMCTHICMHVYRLCICTTSRGTRRCPGTSSSKTSQPVTTPLPSRPVSSPPLLSPPLPSSSSPGVLSAPGGARRRPANGQRPCQRPTAISNI